MAPKAGRGRTAEKTLASVLGIRLEQLAAEHDDLASFLAKVGISPGTYYLLVKGDANPTLDTLELIAKGLGLSVWELLGLNDGIVKKALDARDIDLEAIKASSRARVEALAQLESQRVEFKKKSTGQSAKTRRRE
jgi:transcriptional regulator with XRE-family HTH domain